MNKGKVIGNAIFSFLNFSLIFCFILYSRVSLFFRNNINSLLLANCSPSIPKSFLLNLTTIESVLFILSLLIEFVFILLNIFILLTIFCSSSVKNMERGIYFVRLVLLYVNIILNGVVGGQLGKVIWALKSV